MFLNGIRKTKHLFDNLFACSMQCLRLLMHIRGHDYESEMITCPALLGSGSATA